MGNCTVDTQQTNGTVDDVTYAISLSVLGSVIGNLGELSDVTISSPSNGEVLQYNGTVWVNGSSGAGDMLKSVYDTDDDGVVDNAEALGGSTLAEVLAAGGSVTSVNSQTGTVVLDPDDLDDSTTTNKFTSAADISKLAGIEAGAQINTVDSVNGATGVVVLDTDDIGEGSTNLYYTDARFNAAFSSKTTDDLTQGSTNKYDQTVSISGGTNVTIGGTYPSFSITDNSAASSHTHTASEITDFDTEVANNSAVVANTAKVSNATHTGEVTGSTALTIASNVVDEDNLKVTNAPTDNYILSYDQSSGGFTWIAPSGSGTVTSVAMTVPTGFTVSGSPITSSGTLAVDFDTGYVGYTTTEQSKLSGIESGAEVNNISDVDASSLTGSADSNLHYHSSDRARANHTGTQTASTISDFDTEVSNNTDVAANTSARHNAVTVADTATVDMVLSGQQVSANVISSALDTSDFINSAGFVTASHTHSTTDVTDFSESVADIVGAMVTGNTETNITVTYQDADNTLDFSVPNASTSTRGAVELATTAETQTGTDTSRAVTPDALHDMTSLSGAGWFLDDDNFTANDATKVASQQSIKAYVDSASSSDRARANHTGTQTMSTISDAGSLATLDSISASNINRLPFFVGRSYIGSTGKGSGVKAFGKDSSNNYYFLGYSLCETALYKLSSGSWTRISLPSTISSYNIIDKTFLGNTNTGGFLFIDSSNNIYVIQKAVVVTQYSFKENLILHKYNGSSWSSSMIS